MKEQYLREHGIEVELKEAIEFRDEMESIVFQNYFTPTNIFDKYSNEEKHFK